MALQSSGSAGGKRRREDEEGSQGEAAKVDLLSALTDDVKLIILTLLPLKCAIRTSSLSREWRDRHLWKLRWPDPPPSTNTSNPTSTRPRRSCSKLEDRRRMGYRLDRFSLIVATSTMNTPRFRRCLECVAACSVEDLHIELCEKASDKLLFHFPTSSPLLARLSLRGIRVSNLYYRDARPFPALEVIQLHSVPIPVAVLSKMVALCPSLRVLHLRYCDYLDVLDLRSCNGLRVLDLHYCNGLHNLLYGNNLRVLDLRYCNDIRVITVATTGPPNLRSLTIAECDRVARVGVVKFSNLRSFRYSGAFLSSFYLPGDASLADLYICYRAPILHRVFNEWFNGTLPNLSNLNVLTICSNALQLPTISSVPFVDLFDEVREEPPEDGLENLMVVKILNFNWNHIEVQLVSFMLTKASSLRTLLLVSPNVLPLNVHGIQQADLLPLEEAVASGG